MTEFVDEKDGRRFILTEELRFAQSLRGYILQQKRAYADGSLKWADVPTKTLEQE